MTVVNDIVREWLQANKYDGLINSSEACGCAADDLDACGGPMGECKPAYKHIDSEGREVFCKIKDIVEIDDGHCIGCDFECPSTR